MFVTRGEAQSGDTRSLPDSLILTNNSIVRRVRVPTYEMYKTRWRNGEMYLSLDPEIQRHYWAASMLLPIGTVIVLALVVLLMVLFKRCPQMVAAIVAAILGIIIIFTALMSINHAPIYA
ncbi:uncharacterized protein LOC108623582 [Ceratina calcarata]|uniref:Uncharacterized protein LOC108623582 n=1 Tax=Ceratina calcarata TaxID=156304 RepID=A0AAJ7RZK3_9HYME|nr:uncharacterized protein LOC108623582 [Ceratina calcarata]XP_026668207.1 uncharacterized protein LOC108623582 [Ceratina calcarata]